MDKTRMGKRAASLLLSLVMMLSLLPTAAYATMADGVDTQGAIVSENGTDVSDDSNSSGGTGDLQVEDSEGNGDTGAQQVGGSSGSGTADDTTGAEGGADPTDSVNGNDSADPQDDGDAVLPTAANVVSTSEELVAAIAAASDGDTITLGEGEFTTVGNTSPKKSLTFEGAGTNTVWTIGDLKHAPGGENNGDCSFDGCETITFQNMTLKSDGADYRGFIRISNTAVKKCTLVGKTAYWGYETAKFEDSTFNAPVGDYALWDYSTKAMTFEGCTFNISGKGVNVYVEQPSTDARTVEVNGCTVNSDKAGKAFLNIKNSTQAFDVTLSGTNTVTGLEANGTTGSALYQVETTEVTETTGKPVAVKAKADDGTVTTLYEVKETVEASVAEVNGAKYKSLQAAVDAAKSGATVTLLADTRENVTVSKNAIVLDLNGHTLNGGTENAKPALTVDNKKVTLKDSSEAQTGTIKREDTADTKTSHYVIDIQGKNGFMIVESGKVENNSGIPGVKGSSLIRLGNDSVSGWPTLTIKGGTFTQDNFIAIKVDRGTLHLLGGTVNSANSFAIENWNNAYIKGGTVNGTVSTWVYSTGAAFSKLEISGGTVNGNVASVNYDNAADKQARVYVTGGTVTGTLGTYTYNNGLVAMDETAKATIEVTGGTFSKDPTQYVVENSAITENDDGTFGVAKAYLAKIGDTEYYTMDEAFHAVKAGETIVMLRDYTTNKVQNSGDESFTIDLGGHTWTANIVDTASAAFEINYSDVTLTVKNGKVVSSQLAGLIPSAMSGTITYDNSGLVFENVEMTANGHSGIETNGSNTNDTVTLKNSTLNVPNGYGIYFPSSGTLTIDNSVINAQTMGVQVCSGSLNISGAGTAITVSGDGIAKTENDGAIEDGAAISIVQRTGYKDLSKIEVEDGKFTANGTNAAVKAYKWEEQTASAFDNSKNVVAISGGTFSSEVAKSLCAEGFIPTQNTDGTYGVKEGQYVAKVGDTEYATLQAAIDKAGRNAIVTLLADTRENVTIDKMMTLDLNGHTLNGGTVAGKPALTVTARVTVKDSSEAQTGTIMREDTAENSGVSSHYVIDVQGNGWLTFESGNVKNNSGNVSGKGASLVRVGDDSVAKYPGLNIKGGTFTQDNFIVIKVDRGDLFLNGGTLNSAHSYAIEDWHRATIKGGTVNGAVAAWTYSGGANSDLTISGGTVNGDVTSVNYGSAEGKVAKVSITGGTVNGKLDTRSYDPSTNELTSIEDPAKATIAVTGGTFSSDPTKYVVEDSAITPNADGTFGVAKAYLAKVGDTSYYTMDEAFKAQTASGEPIVLLRDYTTGSAFSSGSIDRTVDLAGHTWTCTGTDANSAAFEINYSDVTLTVKNGKVVSSQLVGLIPSAMGGTIKYDNSSLVFDGVVMTTTARSGIETNGNNTNDTVTLRNSTLNVPNGYGIYFPSSGTLTIDNSVINAQTMGVQVCSGSLNISGAGTAITVSGDGIDKTINDGAIEDGAAISIVNRIGYKGLDEIKVEGGTFTANGTNAAVKAYNWKDLTPSDFTQNDKVSVSGGTFSSAVDKSLCADGYIPTQNADGTYGVKKGADGYVEDENGNVTISTAEGLFYFAKKVNAGNNFAGKTVTLTDNIDLNNEKWTPIGIYGTNATWFKGTFDGQNHAVTGLKVEESGKNGVGFFGKVYTGTIKNLTVEGSVSVSNCNYVGGIVGHGYATITNCTFKGTVGSDNNTMQVGGIAGSGGFTVTNCSVYADVTATYWAGGIVGNCQDGGAYTNCYVEGTISSKSTFWGGGAAGITPVPLYPSQVISGCYSNTVVKVAGEEVNCPIIAAYNNPLNYNGYDGGLKIYDNSWNKQKNSNDSYPIYAEKDGKGGVLMEGMTAARDNSLIMLADDLNYVTGDLSKVRIMAGSSVTQAQIDALAVASVGDSKYQTLTEAIAAAKDGQTVTLLADATEDVVISKSITLDLGGKTLTNTNAGKATISVQSGTVTVQNGSVVGGTSYYNIEAKKDANLTLTDVTATAGNNGSSMIDNYGTLTITSGTYTGGLDTVKNEPSAKLNITGGTFTLTKGNSDGFTGVVFNYGELTISGGEFVQSDKNAPYGQAQVIHTDKDKNGSAAPSTVITGGTFKNLCTKTTAWTVRATNAADGATKVSGGAFNKSVKDYYCADGFIPTKNADGTYGVKEGQYVAQIGSKKYETLADAIRLAAKGKTITLLADVADCGSLTISKNITLDGGGHTISGNSSISVNMPGNAAADVTIKNVNFKDIANGNKLSAFYFSQVKGKLTITGCTFDSIEYEAIQVTPMEGAEVNVSNNVFKAKADGTQVRHIHIEMAYGSGFDCEGQNIKLTVTDNQLHGTVSGDASMGIWWVGTDSTLKVDGNYMEHPETVSITLSNGGVHYNRGDLIYPARSQADADVDDLIPAVIVADKASGESKIKAYSTLADAVAAAQDGQTVRLLADVEQNTQLAIDKSITLDLNGKTIKNTEDIWGDTANAILSITSGAKVTITGNGTIDAKENDCYTINVVKGDLTIENGTFYGNVSVVQVEEGTLSVKGGAFDLHQKWEGSSKYLINCIDDAYVGGSANVAISGGTFVDFDPNVSPEQKVDGKTPSFAAPGVGITKNENGSFTAVDGMTAQILDKDGNSVKAYNKLAEAVAAAQDGQTVRLLADVAESSIKVNANITIDLNKMTVTGSFVTYGEVTIQNGTIDVPDGKTNYAYGKLTLADVDITGKAASSSLLSVNYNGSVTIDKDSTIVADSAKGDYPAVFIKGQDDSGKTYAPELNIYGTVQSAKTPAIQGNGTDRGVSHVNVFEGAVVKSEKLAIYLPQPCEVNITGGLVEGYCGIGIKSGTLNISGGTVRGVANDNVIGDEYSQTNGISYDGSAIMIDSYIGYAGQVQINISGNAVVESKYSTAIREIGNDKSQTNLVGLDITGGTVLGAKDTDAVLVRDVTAKDVNISGGEFSSIVKKEYCAPGFTPVTTANSEGRYGVEIGMFTVMVTSRTTGSDSPVANVAGGGSNITYAQGTTVTASAISGYKFVGWFVNEYTGTPYSTDLACEVKPTDDWTMIAVYEPISGGKFWLTVTASEFTVNGGAVQDSYLYEQFAVGASVTVNFTGSENFLYWVNASNKVVSTEKSYTFIMGSETTLKAVYGKARQNQATVVFISHSDQIISSKAYTTSDTIQFPVPPIKMGCTFTGWSMTESQIRAAMVNNSGIIQVRALYTNPSIACKVTVVYPEGTDNQVVNAVVGATVNVTAKDIEGKTFSYWTDNDGSILGYTKTLKLAPSGDMTVKAVYDQAAEAKPVITMSEVSATTANESYVVTFMATRAVPNGYKVVKQGILWSRDAVCGEDGAAAYMQFDSNGKLPDGVKAYIGNNLDLNGVTRYDIITKYNDRTFYGRGYMVLESDAGKLLYIYTDTIASGSYDSLTK